MDLSGQLLIAMPQMSDPRFSRSVSLICSHEPAGAMGLILNKPVGDMRLSEVFDRLEIAAGPRGADPVYIGGPVETERGFVLHPAGDGAVPGSTPVGDSYALTATQDILENIARGAAPLRFRFALGYAGWGPGQLESEIAQNAWLTAPVSTALVFDTPTEALWDAALAAIGIDPVSLSGTAGRA
ncbi:YqgE/AlgH family protein [Sulfitobacter albidus]|uniref:UPF0301 protein KDD17_11535 n=2 Tax=Sulfitobacter albidus TaxID=2829501 RepID=A0A975JGC4_9RHOB|nr:YqgE/AlgH family protein [Sulfitobacter albidus]